MKEVKLVKKIKRLLKRANTPRWLHHLGPKKYEFWQHPLALFIRQVCKLSYRRAVKLLEELGFDVPSYSALCKMNKRAVKIIERLFYQTYTYAQVVVASIDATTLSRSNPSWHYIKRIDRKKMRKLFRTRTYHRRELSKSLFGAAKQKYGSSVSSRTIQTQKADVYCRAMLYNLSLENQEIFNSAAETVMFKNEVLVLEGWTTRAAWFHPISFRTRKLNRPTFQVVLQYSCGKPGSLSTRVLKEFEEGKRKRDCGVDVKR